MNYYYLLKKAENITTIKTIFKIHPLVYFFAFFAILMGAYKDFLIITVLITIHELGHFLCAKYFSIETDRILIYPLGGITKFHMDISENPKKEFLIICMGPIFQNIGYILLVLLLKDDYLVRTYHLGILLFNLLPIYPLDGGKIVNIIFNFFFSYKTSFKISILMSYIITVIILFLNTKLSINMILVYTILMTMIRREDLKKTIYFHKLLLERLLKNRTFSKEKIIQKIDSFYRYRKNRIRVGNKLYDEKEYLREKYHYF